ncbi:hypothetical protein, partial [Leptospira interrogans]|uniref:hypothetical protein n=1 Tax=Leptospira interrogans TaxID=173 RepID=UPI0009C53D59
HPNFYGKVNHKNLKEKLSSNIRKILYETIMETAATMEMRKLLLLEKNSRLILGIYIRKVM